MNCLFHILNNTALYDETLYNIVKSYHHQARLFILAENEAQKAYLDELLWRYQPEEFMPHEVLKEGQSLDWQLASIWIGDSQSYVQDVQVLLVLSDVRMPNLSPTCHTIVELVVAQSAESLSARARYRTYQSLGFSIKNLHLE